MFDPETIREKRVATVIKEAIRDVEKRMSQRRIKLSVQNIGPVEFQFSLGTKVSTLPADLVVKFPKAQAEVKNDGPFRVLHLDVKYADVELPVTFLLLPGCHPTLSGEDTGRFMLPTSR